MNVLVPRVETRDHLVNLYSFIDSAHTLDDPTGLDSCQRGGQLNSGQLPA